MKKILLGILVGLGLTLGITVLAAVFNSKQLAPSPSNGNCLTTDGTANIWSSGCGGGGGGSASASAPSLSVQYNNGSGILLGSAILLFTNSATVLNLNGTLKATSSIFTNASTTNLTLTGTTNTFLATNSAGLVIPTTTPIITLQAGSGISVSGNTITNVMASSTLTAGGMVTFSPNITFSTTTDTNLLLSIVCATSTCTFNPAWTGTLADGRIASAATWNAKLGSYNVVSANGLISVSTTTNLATLTASTSPTFTNGQFTGTLGVTGLTTLGLASTSAISVSGITWHTGQLNFGNASGTGQTLTNLFLSGATTGCATFTGTLLSSTGVACGSGSGGGLGTTTPFTTGYIPMATGTNVTLSNSVIFQSAGLIGIGTSTPAVKFVIQNTAGTSDLFRMASSSGATLALFDYQGHLQIGTTTNTSNLAIQGTAGQTTNYFNISSSTGTSVFTVASSSTAPTFLVTGASTSNTILQIASSTGTSLMTFDSKGHLGFGGTAPTLTSCNTGTVLPNSTDVSGAIIPGAAQTTCTINFATARTNTPFCVITQAAGTAIAIVGSSTPTTLVITGTTIGNDTITYYCPGN